MLKKGILVCIIALAFCTPARSAYIVHGSHTDHSIISGASLTDVRMSVDLTVSGGKAIITLANASTGLETGAKIKEIVIDAYDNDTSTAILSNPVILTTEMNFEIGESNGLPGYSSETSEKPKLLEFKAKGKFKGLLVGKSVKIKFDTTLSDGDDLVDFAAAFSGGSDTSIHAFGFHAGSSTILNGESLSGINLTSTIHAPEPSVLLLLASGVPLFTKLKRK